MKKVFTTLVAGLMMSAQMMAVSVQDVCGQFVGDLLIDTDQFPARTVYLMPGVTENTVTFVLPDFSFNSGKLGDIVLPNIPMDENGQLTLEGATLYLDSISERATITILNGIEEEGTVYNSVVTPDNAMILLSIEAPSVQEPILVLFGGAGMRNYNYALANGGFEGEWTNEEPEGWHSFGTATGLMADFVKGQTKQFVQSDEVRPGSTGKNSALLSSSLLAGVKANGNCTNGQINAGSMTADDASANYNFSDPINTGFNTPFRGRPDSLVFWAKYQPADLDASKEANKARASVIITTMDRYQDPEAGNDYRAVKLASAEINYPAKADLGWQRLSVPFTYEEAAQYQTPAYILATFTTNMVPGGGTSYSEGTVKKVSHLDSVYLDDAELIYNKELTGFFIGESELTFEKHVASVDMAYCDDCAKFASTAEGVSAGSFIAFDAAHKCIFIYVIADDYAQDGAYNLYRVDFTDSETAGLPPFADEDPSQAVGNVTTRETRYEKVLMNDQLIIRSNDAWYSVFGNRIK